MAKNRHFKSPAIYNEHAIEHVRQYNELKRRLGPIIEDVKTAFYRLPEEDFNHFLATYKSIYGAKAANYALEALPLWKSGQRKMAGQTALRLLNLVPKYLTPAERYNIVKRLCKYHVQKTHHRVSIDTKSPSIGFSEFKACLEEFLNKSILKHLPDHVTETATWLNDDDVVVARRLLSQVDNKISEEVAVHAAMQTSYIYELVNNKKEVKNTIQTIEFPHGTITVNVSTSSSCFIITASVGDENSRCVKSLRKYRDSILLKKSKGVDVVRWYYRYGERVAKLIENRRLMKFLISLSARVLTRLLVVFHPEISIKE